MSENRETLQKEILSVAEEFLKMSGFSGVVSVNKKGEPEKPTYICSIVTADDSRYLIGQGGVNLQAFEVLLRQVLRRRIPGIPPVTVDINDYVRQKNKLLIVKAREAAQKALREHRPVFLEPMNASERRIVHVVLAQDERVSTESVGEKEQRKVVVRPIGIGE